SGDLRPTMAVNLAMLSGSAALLLLTARRVRGHTSLADSFFPLAFLHPGHGENLLMGYEVCHTTSVGLGVALAALTVSRSPAWSVSRATATAAILALLPVTGSVGLMLAAGAVVPLAVVSLVLVRRGGACAGVVLRLGTFLAAAGIGLLLANYP